MANQFLRKPVDGGDQGAWAPYANALHRSTYGTYTCNLYDDSGTLKITTGFIGINDGTNLGVSEIDTITTISLAAVSNSNWAKIEMTVSGTAVTFAAADISGATSADSLPSDFTDAYNGEKGGFYITSTKRCIGLAWVNAGGTLEGVINTIGGQESYNGYSQSDDADDIPYYFYQSYQHTNFGSNKLKVFYGRYPTVSYQADATDYNTVYDALSSFIPDEGDKVLCHGSMVIETAANNATHYIFDHIERTSDTNLRFYNCRLNVNIGAGTVVGGTGIVDMTDGNTTTVDHISVSI